LTVWVTGSVKAPEATSHLLVKAHRGAVPAKVPTVAGGEGRATMDGSTAISGAVSSEHKTIAMVDVFIEQGFLAKGVQA
jgi:hypothetical protein